MSIRLAIVDDHSVVAELLSHTLQAEPSIEIVAVQTQPEALLAQLAHGLKIDMVMSDYSMPTMNGIELCCSIRHLIPHVKCILLTMHDAIELRYRARRAGIEGFLLKTTGIDGILSYIAGIDAGYVEEPSASPQAINIRHEAVALSHSEIEVVRCVICREMSTKEAAEFLFRSHHTIEQHRKNIYAKLEIDSVAALAKYALESGICKGIDT